MEKIKRIQEVNSKGPNLSKLNRDYAIFLPSISAVYARHASQHITLETSPRAGKHPAGVPSSECLDFLNPNKGHYYYGTALYSAGHAVLDIEKSKQLEGMVQNRDYDNSFILGDSGGFQIGKGVIDFDFKDFTGSKSNAVRTKIQNWLEETSDYAMILDIPPWAIGKQPGIEDFESCLEGTVFNNNFFLRNRQGKTKYLNVLQGRTDTEASVWFDAIKDMPFEGWAFAGNYTTDFEMTLRRIVRMRDDHYFEENSQGDKRTWIHFLGQSKPILGCAWTTLQRILRRQVDEEIYVSYDSASAFICSARGGCYSKDVFEPKRFSYLMEKMWDDHNLIGSTLPFPWNSSIGDNLTMGDICVRPLGWEGKDIQTSWDTYSYILLMAHNVERHIRAIQQANKIYDLPHDNGKIFMPSELVEITEVLEDIMQSETPQDEITKHHPLLNKFTGRRQGKGVQVDLSDMFQFTEETFDPNAIDLEDQDDEMLQKLTLE